MTTPGLPPNDPTYTDTRWGREHSDLLKKIATLLSVLVALGFISVILQVVGLVTANNTADEISDRLDDIRSNTSVNP